jgi:hypothetical protein
MGLWAQNIGVNAPSLPPAVVARAGSELFGVPEEMEGWTWATVDDKSFLDIGELDTLLADTAKEAGAPALAFSVHDSDSVYLAGADASGLRFRVVVNPEAWEDELPRQEVVEAASWSKDHAPLDPSPEDIANVLTRKFVFGEEGLDVLFARMGLLSSRAGRSAPPPAEAPEEIGDASMSKVWNSFEHVDAPKEQILERGRWHAKVEHGDVRGRLLAAEEAEQGWVSVYGVRPGEPIVSFGRQIETLEVLWAEATRQGMTLGPWEEVPDGVSRDLASTATWLLGQA